MIDYLERLTGQGSDVLLNKLKKLELAMLWRGTEGIRTGDLEKTAWSGIGVKQGEKNTEVSGAEYRGEVQENGRDRKLGTAGMEPFSELGSRSRAQVRDAVQRTVGYADELELLDKSGSRIWNEAGWDSGGRAPSHGEEHAESVLLRKLERIDQVSKTAVALRSALGQELYPSRRRENISAFTSAGGRNWGNMDIENAEGSWAVKGYEAGPGSGFDLERRAAEQTDRVFRRDSRRYDGGFYLY